MKKSFKVTGMSCANCVANVEKAVRKIKGIEEAPNTTGAEFMSGPQPSALGSATIFVFKKTVLARAHERPR